MLEKQKVGLRTNTFFNLDDERNECNWNRAPYREGLGGDDGFVLGDNQVPSSPLHKVVLSGEHVQPIGVPRSASTSDAAIGR